MCLQGKTPGFHSSLSEQEFPERVTAERTIRDLQRTIQLLEMEVEQTKQELVRRHEKHTAAIALLKQEHAIEVKTKDEIIEKLSQRSVREPETSPLLQSKKLFLSASKEPRSAVTTHKTVSRLTFGPEATSRNPIAIETIYSAPVTKPALSENSATVSTPIAPARAITKRSEVSPLRPVSKTLPPVQDENLSTTIPVRSIMSQTMAELRRQDMISKNALPVVFAASGGEQGAARRVGLRPFRHSSNKISSQLPPMRQAVKEPRPRAVDPAPRRMSISHQPPRSPPLPRFFSPSKPCPQTSRPLACSTRKRSFWDITNTNSPPAAPLTRAARRLSVAAPSNTPSLLLQVPPTVPIGDAFDSFWNSLVRNARLSNAIYQKIKADFYVCVGALEQWEVILGWVWRLQLLLTCGVNWLQNWFLTNYLVVGSPAWICPSTISGVMSCVSQPHCSPPRSKVCSEQIIEYRFVGDVYSKDDWWGVSILLPQLLPSAMPSEVNRQISLTLMYYRFFMPGVSSYSKNCPYWYHVLLPQILLSWLTRSLTLVLQLQIHATDEMVLLFHSAWQGILWQLFVLVKRAQS